ncbi:hypothetical protein FCV25MIE_28814 [Fagus crenata]
MHILKEGHHLSGGERPIQGGAKGVPSLPDARSFELMEERDALRAKAERLRAEVEGHEREAGSLRSELLRVPQETLEVEDLQAELDFVQRERGPGPELSVGEHLRLRRSLFRVTRVAQSLGDEAAGLIQGLDPDDSSLATGMGRLYVKVASRLRDF